jgi:RNA ligase
MTEDTMGAMPEFREFPKIFRLHREFIITEKIDGTNACVRVTDSISPAHLEWENERLFDERIVMAGSRTRWVTPEKDNFGFAKWVRDHARQLLGLGVGTHYGEWWGKGVQRGYGMQERRFSLFNVTRWAGNVLTPSCCHTVPVLARCDGHELNVTVESTLRNLSIGGSWAAPGYTRPEGIVAFHVPSGYLFKSTLERDEEPKGR